MNLLVLFGVLFTSFGLCCLAIFTQELMDAARFSGNFRWKAPHIFFLSAGAVSILTGVGLMLRQKWARMPATLMLILAAGAWVLFALSEVRNFRDEGIIMIGFSVFLFSAFLFGVFFLNNDYVIRNFDSQDLPQEKNEDILDW